MQNWRRLLYFVLLNVLISALTTWAVVTVVLRNYGPPPPEVEPTFQIQPAVQTGELIITQPPSTPSSDEVADTPFSQGILDIDAIIGAGELAVERVLIQHVGEDEVSLNGWQLQDEDGNVFPFPALTMFSGGAVTVYSKTGTSTVVELYWGQEEAIWEIGEKAYLIDPTGEIRAVYQVP
jgi:hypothetical protein